MGEQLVRSGKTRMAAAGMKPEKPRSSVATSGQRSRGLLVGLLAAGAVMSAGALAWIELSPPAAVSDASQGESASGPPRNAAFEDGALQPGQASGSQGLGGAQPDALSQAGDETPAAVAATLDDDGRFTGPGEQWPPAVRNATDRVEVDLGQDTAQQTEDQVADSFDDAAPAADPSEAVLADPTVQAALGDDYDLVAVYSDEASGTAEYLFFSNDTSQTVLAYVENWQFLNADVWPAGQFQPELSDDEKVEAVQLARSHWESKGDSRIDLLEGFAILAVRPDNGSYYDTRTAYVNFSVNIDSAPELVGWVDLSNGQVFDERVER